jgi:hypothetical protein
MLETGLIIFLAFWLLWIKLNVVTRLKALGHPFLLDLSISITVWLMYGGTGSGMAAATAAAVVMSINISIARKLFGYYEKRNGEWYYIVGKLNQADKIKRTYYEKIGASQHS